MNKKKYTVLISQHGCTPQIALTYEGLDIADLGELVTMMTEHGEDIAFEVFEDGKEVADAD